MVPGNAWAFAQNLQAGQNAPMCSHYQAIKERAKFEKEFRVKLPPYAPRARMTCYTYPC